MEMGRKEADRRSTFGKALAPECEERLGAVVILLKVVDFCLRSRDAGANTNIKVDRDPLWTEVGSGNCRSSALLASF